MRDVLELIGCVLGLLIAAPIALGTAAACLAIAAVTFGIGAAGEFAEAKRKKVL